MVAVLLAHEEAHATAQAAGFFAGNAWLIPALPFVAVGVIVFFGKRFRGKGAEVGIAATSISWLLSVIILVTRYVGGGGPVVLRSVRWFPLGRDLGLGLGMRLDGLTSIMFVVVTTVSLLVQIYSLGYMHGDRRYTWYYAALNIFTGSMLNLVIADNLMQLLIGWELVGICSYLLIGHWWEEKPNSDAAIKAFITTKTGDIPFLIGVFVLFAAARTFNITEIIHQVEDGNLSHVTLTAAAILLFGGAIGKSAQFPLHVWLPDAMAGPTPVSALIHAATMVTAGVFLVARLFPVFEASPQALNEVALIGAFTMLLAALLAMVQDDIKRVLAYSTVSQLAYMMAALGVGAGNAGIFHLFTHAWFKALLFLGAGSVIHAVHSNNMSEMGGLRKFMPHTYRTFLIGSVALAGIPPLAGFWSKDEILTEAFRVGARTIPAHGSPVVGSIVYGVGIVTAFLTAFYMSRAVHLTFQGEYRGHGRPHESPATMTGPLWVLAGLSLVAGFAGFPGWQKGFGAWVGVGGETRVPEAHLLLIAVSVVVALAGIGLGRALYARVPARDPLLRLGWFHTLLVNKYYLDEFYMRGIVRPIRDRVSAAIGTRKGGGILRYLQSGDVQRYAAALFAGVAILAFLFTKF
ncbi:MAG: NADH-quinone oxidoreductase subunit L [Acidobacteria bacterium]|nr:NADH-quinone oxidoreductase subunit L [Acidobacteriota bacterium]